MKKIIFLFTLIVVFAVSTTAYAAEFLTGRKDTGGQVSVPASETHKNLYAAGSQVAVNGTTVGDLTVAGSSLVLNGPVSGGLLAVGGSIFSNANISGNARAAGGNITVSGPVGGDLVAAGGSVNLSESGAVAGDLIMAGGVLTIDAPIGGSAHIAGKTVFINSKINGSVNVTASQDLSFGPRAEVVGTVHFRGTKPALVDPAAKVKSIDYTQFNIKNPTPQFGRFAGLGILIQLLAFMIVGFVMMRFGRSFVVDSAGYVKSKPWASLGLGIVGLIVIPIVIILLFVTVIGYYAALLVLLSYIVLLALTTILGTLFLGEYILRLFNKSALGFPDWQIIVLGVIVWEILKLIPIVGWVILAVIYLMVLGAALAGIKRKFQQPA